MAPAVSPTASSPGDDNGKHEIGYRIFRWLLGLLAAMLLALFLFGWLTYPDQGDISGAIAGITDTKQRNEIIQGMQDRWFQQVRDIGQLFILTPVFPLLGAVVGYIFGSRKQK